MPTVYMRAFFWLGLILAFGYFVAAISDVLLPFVVGILVAYFLDPQADRLERMGLSRTQSSLIIVAVFCLVFVTLLAFLVPVLVEQAIALANNLPQYLSDLADKYGPRLRNLLGSFNEETVDQLKETATAYSKQAIGVGTVFAAGAFKSGMALLNIISLIFISPIVAFYMLRDWDRITAKIDSWLPRKHAPVIREQLRLMDRSISGFIRGQTNVCLLLGAFYATGLSLVGLNNGILIGFLTGILSFIPYVGMLIGTVLGLAVAFFQSHDIVHVLMVAGVFALGQFLEGNFVTPKLVGDKVGLHPVWIIFALLAGGALFGFLGILVAVPLLAIVAVLVRFALKQYLKSGLYTEKRRSARKAR